MSVIALLFSVIVAFSPSRAAQRHVERHLDGALRVLEQRDLSALTDDQRRRRAAVITALKSYRDAGQFPVNRDFPGEHVPYFIDPVTDAHCAVGHLMAVTGHGALARRLAAADNHVRVMDLRHDAEIVAWLSLHGLTLEEAARIQPSYDGGGPILVPNPDLPTGDRVENPLLNPTALRSAMGVSGALFVAQSFTTLGQGGRFLPTANLVLGLATTAMGVASSESAGLRVATGAVGLVSAVAGVSALQGGGAPASSARRVRWRLGPTLGGRAFYAGANWRF